MKKVRIEKGTVFQRHEKKYQLQEAQYKVLIQQLDTWMRPDDYGKYTICSLYYDTDDFAVIRRCLEKPKFRQKLRLRSYGVPKASSTVYLELKKKFDGVTYKRRIPLSLAEATAYLEHGLLPVRRGQNFNEIDWYIKQQPFLHGKALLCYDRIALTGREDPGFRITFDSNIRWRDYHLQLNKGDYGRPLLPPGSHLMEVKTTQALPLWLLASLSQQGIYPTSFSKYGTLYNNNLCQKEVIHHAV